MKPLQYYAILQIIAKLPYRQWPIHFSFIIFCFYFRLPEGGTNFAYMFAENKQLDNLKNTK